MGGLVLLNLALWESPILGPITLDQQHLVQVLVEQDHAAGGDGLLVLFELGDHLLHDVYLVAEEWNSLEYLSRKVLQLEMLNQPVDLALRELVGVLPVCLLQLEPHLPPVVVQVCRDCQEELSCQRVKFIKRDYVI